MVAPTVCILYLRRGGFYILPPQRKVTFSFPLLGFLTLLFLLSKVAQKKKKQKENAVKETRKRGLFEKSPLLTPLKTFEQPAPGCWACGPKVTYQPTGRTARCPLKTFGRPAPNFRYVRPTDSESRTAGARTARCPPHVMCFSAFFVPFAQGFPSDRAPGGSRRHRTSGNG